MTEMQLGQQTRASYSVSAMATHSLPCKSACDGHKGESVDGVKKEECLMAERTRKYESVARMKKNTMVPMGEDAPQIGIGRMKVLVVGKWCV